MISKQLAAQVDGLVDKLYAELCEYRTALGLDDIGTWEESLVSDCIVVVCCCYLRKSIKDRIANGKKKNRRVVQQDVGSECIAIG